MIVHSRHVAPVVLVFLLVATCTAQNCGGNDVDALPLIAGAEILGHGFNAKTGQNGTAPGLEPIYLWTFFGGCTWTSPSTGVTYKVPDQLTETEVTGGSANLAFMVTDSYSMAFDLYRSSFTFSAGFHNGSFSAAIDFNHELYEEHSILSEQLAVGGFSEAWVSYYSLDLPPVYVMARTALSYVFQQSISLLPPTITNSSDEQMYTQFVTSYGTHMVSYALFGGYAHQLCYLNRSIAQQHSVKDVTNEFKLMFGFTMFNVSTNYFSNRSAISFKSWFAENARVATFFSGGNPALMSNNTLSEWLYSVPDNAQLLNTTLTPLSELLYDDPVKQQTLAGFIESYLASQ